jgi:hypothetical protein
VSETSRNDSSKSNANGVSDSDDRIKEAAALVEAPLKFRAQPLPFTYDRGESGKALPVEATGGGVGLLDYDGDGDLDVFFAQGKPLAAESELPHSVSHDVLLRNDGSGRFVDVSDEVGLAPRGYGQGIEVGDYDGDGDPDVYVSRYGTNTLWRNEGGSRFVDATESAGVGCPLWSLGAAFADYDGDGDLDLFVANYFAFDSARAPFSRDEQGRPRYGMPAEFPGLPDVLYRNEGQGRFADVTDAAGLAGNGRGMGCLASDFDADGHMDILVANDAEANVLWRNRGDGTFEDMAAIWGVAFNGDGQVEANMGLAQGDTDGDGFQDILITHFFQEHDTLWRKRRLASGDSQSLSFQDETREAGLAIDSRPMTGWGTVMADFDLDGRLDLIVTNGHIRSEPAQAFLYENPPLLWWNEGNGRFRNVTRAAGAYFDSLHIGRGMAAGDLNGDGLVDLVIVHHHEPAVVLWNESPRHGAGLALELRGKTPNRQAIGARVSARVGSQQFVASVDGGGSYLSANTRQIHLGLGEASRVDRIEVVWPSGLHEVRTNLELPVDGGVLIWEEGESTEPAE